MSTHNVILPSKPRIVKEDVAHGVYEIDGLYPGYGHTLGNSLRRIILSSLPGAAITSLKIAGVAHEFSVIDGVKEDAISLILNLKKVRFAVTSGEKVTAHLKVTGPMIVTAKDIECPGQVAIANPDQYICEITSKIKLDVEISVERGMGYVSKEVIQKEKVDIGTIAVDAAFAPIRRVSYEVEDMRVGDKTNHNRLRISIETDGTITPREALEQSISLMIAQLQAIVGFKEEIGVMSDVSSDVVTSSETGESNDDPMKKKLEEFSLSTRTLNSLQAANIKTLGGLSRKKEEDLLEIDGIGEKGILEIKRLLSDHGVTLK